MIKQTLQRGFTLIELLVVIAIIGILAATVLASLGSARQGGNNASAQSSVSNVRAQAEFFFNSQNPGTYAGMCNSSGINALVIAARNNGQGSTAGATSSSIAIWSATPATNRTSCMSNAVSWVVAVPLNGTAPGTFYCADSTGAGRINTGAHTVVTPFRCL